MKLNCTTGTQVGEESVGAGRADVAQPGRRYNKHKDHLMEDFLNSL